VSLAPQTITEKYYALNAALNAFLTAQGVNCPVIKFGVDPKTLQAVTKSQTVAPRYPYMQSFIMNPRPSGWTSDAGGIYTRFEYQLSFFTSPETEIQNDTEQWLPYHLARMAFSDISLNVFLRIDENTEQTVTIADLLRLREDPSFSMVSGAPVPKAVMIAEMAAVCAYPVRTPDPGISTDLDIAIAYTAR